MTFRVANIRAFITIYALLRS